MGKISDKISKIRHKQKTGKRKHLLRRVIHDLIKIQLKSVPTEKYSLPTKRYTLIDILSDESNQYLSIKGCYMYKEPNNRFNNSFIHFNFGEFYHAEDPFKFVLPYIKGYNTQFESRIETFLQTIFICRWRLILHLIISAKVTDQQNKIIASENYVHLDDNTNFVIERLFQYSVYIHYYLTHLLRNLSDILRQYERNDDYKNDDLIQKTLMDIHISPFEKNVSIFTTDSFLSVRFYVPKEIFVYSGNHHLHEIDPNMLKREQIKCTI